MRSAVVAGVVYFASVFAAGFVLGTIRVLALEPRIGELTAGLIELPIILGFAWVLCGRLVKRFAVPSSAPAPAPVPAPASAPVPAPSASVSEAWLG